MSSATPVIAQAPSRFQLRVQLIVGKDANALPDCNMNEQQSDHASSYDCNRVAHRRARLRHRMQRDGQGLNGGRIQVGNRIRKGPDEFGRRRYRIGETARQGYTHALFVRTN